MSRKGRGVSERRGERVFRRRGDRPFMNCPSEKKNLHYPKKGALLEAGGKRAL